MSTNVLATAVSAMQTINTALQDLVVETMDAEIAAKGYCTAWDVTCALRAQAAADGVTGRVDHQAIRQAVFAAWDGSDANNPNGPLAQKYAKVQDNGDVTGVMANPPILYYDPAKPAQALIDARLAADPNAPVAPAPPITPTNGAANGSTLSGTAYSGLTVVD